MKVTGLLLIALGLVALAQAHEEYHLQCTPEEMNIRWPSYKSKSEYYVCPRVGDRPMVIPCDNNKVFTFVLQICTSTNKYIPAPAFELLPISSHVPSGAPVAAHPHQNHHNTHHNTHPKNPLDAIKPVHSHHNHQNVPQPPIFSESNLPQIVPHLPPMEVIDSPRPPILVEPEHNKPTDEKETEHQLVKPHKPANRPPMPPTPAPTPPVVNNNVAKVTKKPLLPKKPSVEKPKVPSKAPSKPTANKADNKPADKTEKKAPKKAPKKPVAPVKKAPKAPTKE